MCQRITEVVARGFRAVKIEEWPGGFAHGDLATDIAIARLEMNIGQELAAPEAVFEAIPELEFDQTPNQRVEVGHDRLGNDAGVDAEPIPELEFDQTLGW